MTTTHDFIWHLSHYAFVVASTGRRRNLLRRDGSTVRPEGIDDPSILMKAVTLCGSNVAVLKMFDTDKFITCIQEKPALWDKSAKEYSDKNAREKAWIEVGENFHEDWAELEAKEKEEK
ncbi:hypothetical protein PV328_011945, partial [Microctonus aethiopoides]